MKFFEIDEANDLLPDLIPDLERIQRLYEHLAAMREPAKSAAQVSDLGGGMEGGSRYVKTLYEVGKLTTKFHESGVQLKDYSKGLIDFPCLRDGRIILLCWQLGDGPEITWWHETDTGFAGRQPL
jgi:Uncharacterized conserved protein